MALVNCPKKGMNRKEVKKAKSLLLPGPSLASVESLSMPLMQEVVILADIRCDECQRRVADIMSRMKETESVSVDVLEKKVTLKCTYPGGRVPSSRQIVAANKKSLGKMALIQRIIRGFRQPIVQSNDPVSQQTT